MSKDNIARTIALKNAATIRDLTNNTFATPMKAILFGDSLIDNNGPTYTSETTLSVTESAHIRWANCMLGQAFEIVDNLGIGGNTSADMLVRLQDVLDLKPDYVFMNLTSNDINGLEDTAEYIKNRYIEMTDNLLKEGIKIILLSCVSSDSYFDSGDTTKKQSVWHEINLWAKSYFRNKGNVVYIDIASVGVNADTGRPITGWTDGTHPYGVLSIRMGAKIAEVVESLIKMTDMLPITNIDERNALTNGMMTGNVNGIATGYTVSSGTGATQTTYKETRKDDISGELQVVDVSAVGSTNSSLNSPSVLHGFDVGDWVYFEQEVDLREVTNLVHVYTEAIFQNSAYGGTAISFGFFSPTTTPDLDYPFKGVIRSEPIQLQEGDVRVRLINRFIGLGKFKFGRCRIWKVE